MNRKSESANQTTKYVRDTRLCIAEGSNFKELCGICKIDSTKIFMDKNSSTRLVSKNISDGRGSKSLQSTSRIVKSDRYDIMAGSEGRRLPIIFKKNT